LALALLLVAAPAAAYQDPLTAFSFVDERIVESSGLARSPRNLTVVWTHNDSGSPLLFAVDFDGETHTTVELEDVEVFDWEDIASGPSPIDGSPSLFIGDVGDNVEDDVTRASLFVHVVTEPDLAALVSGGTVGLKPTTWELVWPDAPHDVETLLVQPDGSGVILVTKSISGESIVATADLSGDPAEIVTLVEVGQVSLVEPDPPNAAAGGPLGPVGFRTATGGDVDPDGRKVAIRTYEDLLEWDVADGDVVAALSTPPRRIDLPDSTQGEGLAYGTAGSILASSEGVGAPVHVLLPDVGVDEVITTPPRPDEDDDGGTSPAWLIVIAAGLVIVVALGARRRPEDRG